MIADHTLKIHGFLYKVGEELPTFYTEGEKPKVEPVKAEPVAVETKANTEKPFTKTELVRMTSAQLREIATKYGIKDVEELTGSEIKKKLIVMFEL